MNNFSSIVHLVGRYNEITKNKDFLSWIQKYGGEVWHEQLEGETVTIVVQSLDRMHLFAAKIKREEDLTEPQRVLQTASINILDTETFIEDALFQFTRKTKIDVTKVHAVRPIVTFAADGTASMSWEIETLSDKKPQTRDVYHYTKKVGLKAERTEAITNLQNQPDTNVVPILSDSLSANELHHLENMLGDATAAVGGATTTESRARAIFNYIRKNYAYDATIYGIDQFTWADILTRDTNGRRGICDEWAVVQASMLRSLGIPARIKFLIWKNGDKFVGHACLEYLDGNIWYHMDALWNAFHNPGIYLASGATNLTVMDADYPLDGRSTGPTPWGMKDPTGDLKLYPYGDFIINPSYPGESRLGYSY